MKHKSHKLLSLLLAFALMFSLVPAALADDAHTTHQWDAGTTKTPATCTTAGERILNCTGCTATMTEPIPALGHAFGTTPVASQEATCLEKGYREYRCTRTGCNVTQTEEIAPLGHNYTYTDDRNGSTHTATCSRCTTNTAGHTTIEAHKYGTNGICTATGCNAVNPSSKVTVSITPSTVSTLSPRETVQLTATVTTGQPQSKVEWGSQCRPGCTGN